MKKTLTPLETAGLTGHPQSYVYLLIRLGRLKAQRVDGRWQIDPDSLEAHIQQQREFNHANAVA